MDQKNDYTNEPYDFSILEELFLVKSLNSSNSNYLKLNSAFGVGYIKSIELSNGIISLDFDLTLNQTVEIPINFIELSSTQFIYVVKGECDYISDSGDAINLKQFQTAISVSKSRLNAKLRFKKNTKIILNIIDLRKHVYTKILDLKDCIYSLEVLTFIDNINDSHKTLFSGQYNIKIAEHFKQYFEQIKLKKISALLFVEGVIYLILSNHFQSIIDEGDENSASYLLNPTELNKINILSDQIRENPEVQYSLGYLTSESGLSQAKLQEGFKSLFNRTVTDFIRHMRLTKAEELISTTDLNMSEIVYSVGFTSRSYFSKIFRNEFNCTPKQYKNEVKNIASLRMQQQIL